jgi:hypothetical protein
VLRTVPRQREELFRPDLSRKTARSGDKDLKKVGRRLLGLRLADLVPVPEVEKPSASEVCEQVVRAFLGYESIPALRELQIDIGRFSPEWNRDYRISENVVHGERGGLPYEAPEGFMRYGLKVRGRFDNGNDTWLGKSNLPGEWVVAYHGTRPEFVKGIAESPLAAGGAQAYGYGIYCTPSAGMASTFSPPAIIDGKKYRYVFMCRVNARSVHHCTESRCPEGKNPEFTLHMTVHDGYWFVNAENQDYQTIRPYGLLVQELDDEDGSDSS